MALGQPHGEFSMDQHAKFNIEMYGLLQEPRRHPEFTTGLEARVASKRDEVDNSPRTAQTPTEDDAYALLNSPKKHTRPVDPFASLTSPKMSYSRLNGEAATGTTGGSADGRQQPSTLLRYHQKQEERKRASTSGGAESESPLNPAAAMEAFKKQHGIELKPPPRVPTRDAEPRHVQLKLGR